MSRLLRGSCAFASLLALAFLAWHAARAVGFPFPLDYGEGPLLEQARILAAGGAIYRPTFTGYPFTIGNYPPVFPLLLAVGTKLFGLTYVTGRAVTTLATAACVALVAAIVHTATRDRWASLAGAAAFAASPYVVFWSSLVRVDFVALSFSLCAVLLVARRPEWRACPFAAGGLVVLAVMTRQTHLLAAPLAIGGFFLAARGWRRALGFVVTVAVGTMAAVGTLELITGGGFLVNTVKANMNHFSFPLLAHFMGDFAVTSALLYGIAAFTAARRLREGGTKELLLPLYLLGASLSALTIGKVGSHVNYLLEVSAAISILGGVAVAGVKAQDAAWQRVALPALVSLQIVWLTGLAALRPENIESKLGQRGEYEKLTRALAETRGDVLADEAMGMLVITGHPILLQPFEFTQLAREHVWDETPVVTDLKAGRFALVLINDGPSTPAAWTRDRWTADMLAAVHETYEPTDALAGATLYRVKRPQ